MHFNVMLNVVKHLAMGLDKKLSEILRLAQDDN